MIRRLLALFGYVLVSRSDADLLAGIKAYSACMIHRLPLTGNEAAYVVIGIREATDEEFLKAVGLTEGKP